jgi:hypothetical protein
MRRFSLPGFRLLGGSQWANGGASALAHLPTTPTFQELRPAIEGELRRSRRYERPLAVLVIAPSIDAVSAGNGTRGAGDHSNGTNGAAKSNGVGGRHDSETLVAHSYALTTGLPAPAQQPLYWAQLRLQLLGSVLCGTLRESDIVGYAVEVDEFVALLPECDESAARRAISRLHALYFGRTGSGLRAGLAVFPRDGLTLDDLVIYARQAYVLAAQVSAAPNHNGHGAAFR